MLCDDEKAYRAYMEYLDAMEQQGKQADPDKAMDAVLDALEAAYPVLRGTIRDHGTLKRRPFLRFFACEQDLSHEPPDAALPEPVAAGTEPFSVAPVG